jgi:hypothetical protein
MKKKTNALMMAACVAATALPAGAEVLQFERQKIGNVIYEACSVFDVDKDGKLDIFTGEYWFSGPDFTEPHKVTNIRRMDDYYDDFSNYPMDVNGDGHLDIITGGWWNQTMCWRENPGDPAKEWDTHIVAQVGNIERNCFYDIDKDGTPEIFSTTKPVHFFKLNQKDGKGDGTFTQYTINEGGGGHGFGYGDINGDGRGDLLYTGGWHEAPEDPFNVAGYVWHPEFDFGAASVPIIVHDVNKDGVNDIIVGQGHDYGLAWYEQGKDAEGKRTWTKHDIETDKSQFHEMQLADIDNDGEPELITGKRYRAHNEGDPGAGDPIGIYYYELNGGNVERVTIDYGTPDKTSGTGIYLWIEDVDGNGYKDIIAPGKQGMYLFKNKGPGAK